MKSPTVPAKKRRSGSGGAGFALGCGCKDAKSVSVSASPSPASSTRTSTTTRRRSGAGTTTDTQTSSSSFSVWEEAVAELRYKNNGDSGRLQESSAVTTASFSGLLRELSELEKSVASLRPSKVHHNEEKLSPVPSPPLEHKKAKGDDDKGDLFRAGNKENQLALGVDGVGLEGSVAVVKQSDDPLGDFRQSMVQLIVENGIVAAEDLREMLRRFLTLNSPHHHDAILRAFAEIWDNVFVATSLDRVATPGWASVSRREPGRAPVPRTPPRHLRSPPAWRV